jgi:hypothetical protein
MAADLMKALIAREKAGYIEVVEETDDHITQRAVRTDGRGPKEPQLFTWSQEDTTKAELTGSTMNKKYPRVHKEHRCTAVLARRVFPDIIGGLLCPEEAEELTPHVIEAHFDGAQEASAPEADPPAAAAQEVETVQVIGEAGVQGFNDALQEEAMKRVTAGVLAVADMPVVLRSIATATKREAARRGYAKIADVPEAESEDLLAHAVKQLPALPESEAEEPAELPEGGAAPQPLPLESE